MYTEEQITEIQRLRAERHRVLREEKNHKDKVRRIEHKLFILTGNEIYATTH